MAIIVDRETKLVVQGLTGSEGSFHGLRNKRYGTQVVAGVTPGKGGQDVEGVPVYGLQSRMQSRRRARTRPWSSSRRASQPTRSTRRSTPGSARWSASRACRPTRCCGSTRTSGRRASPCAPTARNVAGKANLGIIPAEIFTEGSIGLVSRSGTLTYQIGHEADAARLGSSTIVGIGGDPVVGSSFIDVLERFDPTRRPSTSSWSTRSAATRRRRRPLSSRRRCRSRSSPTSPATAPPGKTMGHAGAIISGSSGTARGKGGARGEGSGSRHLADRDSRDRREIAK